MIEILGKALAEVIESSRRAGRTQETAGQRNRRERPMDAAARIPAHGPSKKPACDVCGKRFDTLGSYGDDEWWVCMNCFDTADAIASLGHKWPDGETFAALKRVLAERNEKR